MPEFDRKEFGRRLQAFRKQIGRSQENLGRVIKKSATTIGRFEKGTLLPNAEEIYLLCNELGIEEYQLFNSFNKVISKKESLESQVSNPESFVTIDCTSRGVSRFFVHYL